MANVYRTFWYVVIVLGPIACPHTGSDHGYNKTHGLRKCTQGRAVQANTYKGTDLRRCTGCHLCIVVDRSSRNKARNAGSGAHAAG
jgi:hypothetical protein